MIANHVDLADRESTFAVLSASFCWCNQFATACWYSLTAGDNCIVEKKQLRKSSFGTTNIFLSLVLDVFLIILGACQFILYLLLYE